jgi:2-hydroxychromene-2-carboxylate isomerase
MSPYSWLAAERIEQFLPGASWQPVAGAVIHAASGRRSWGVTDARAANVAECERRASERGLGAIRWPVTWPSDGTRAARALTFAKEKGDVRPLALAIMRMSLLEGRDIADRAVLAEAGLRAGFDDTELLAALDSVRIAAALDATTHEAIAMGVTGMPTVVIGGELFWGDDRLESAAARGRYDAARPPRQAPEK